MKVSQRWALAGTSVTVLFLLVANGSSLASAASNPSTNEVRVSPALSNVQLSGDETSTTIMTTVSNMTSIPLTVNVSAHDFGASATSADSISLFESNYNPAKNPHSLQTAVSFSMPQVQLAPHSSQKVPVTLSNFSQLAPGGHYGAILFSPEVTGVAGSNSKVSIHPSVASLIFLTTASGGTQTLSLGQFPVGHLQFSLPQTSYVAIDNVGNTQAAPIGQLSLFGPGGGLVASTVLNPGSGLILPESTRLFTVDLPLHATFALPGIYRLELQYQNSTQGSFTVVNKRFLLINFWVILPVLLIAILVVYIIRKFGKKLLRVIVRLVRALKHLIHRKKTPPPDPPTPKPKPRLIQG